MFTNLAIVWGPHIVVMSGKYKIDVTPHWDKNGRERTRMDTNHQLQAMSGEYISSMYWVCLKIVYPCTQWLMIIIPTKWL